MGKDRDARDIQKVSGWAYMTCKRIVDIARSATETKKEEIPSLDGTTYFWDQVELGMKRMQGGEEAWAKLAKEYLEETP